MTPPLSFAALATMLVWGAAPSKKAPAAPLPFDKVEGPFASLDAACAGCRETKAVAKPAAPFLDVRVVVSGRPDRPGTRDEPHVHFLAARLSSGWWRLEIGTETAHDGSYVSVYENRIETADVVPGGGAEVLVETRNETRGHLPREMDGRPVYFDDVETVRFAEAARTIGMVAMLVATGDASAAPPSQELVPLTGEAMRGPFAKLSAACADCSASIAAPERREVPKPAAPFLDVRVIVSGDLKQRPSYSTPHRHYLAARLASGWWLHEIGYDAAATGRNESTRIVSEQRLETTDVLPGGGAEILVETKETTHSGGRVRSQIDDRHLHICGVGTSGRPSCTDVHTYRFVGHMADSWDTTVSFLKDGTVVQAGEAGSSHLERRYVVRFP